MPGSTPATSQLDWLISTTAITVLSWSRATRDLLKSFGWGIRALHQLVAATMVPSPRRLPHTISLVKVARAPIAHVLGGTCPFFLTAHHHLPSCHLWPASYLRDPAVHSGRISSMAEPQLSVRSAKARDLARRLARREGRSIADVVERALEAYEIREAAREPGSVFYARLANDYGGDLDLEVVVRENRKINTGPVL